MEVVNEEPALSRWEQLAALSVLVSLIISLLDIHIWHPGAAWPDELLTNVGLLQEWREGQALPLSFAKGCVHRFLLLIVFAGQHASLARLHWPEFIAFFAENIALGLIARRALNRRAAALAVMVNAIAAFSLLRLRSLLSYSISASELLVLIACLPYLSRRLPSLLWGLAAALFLLDYEAWLLALPVLALGIYLLPRAQRPALSALLLGFGLGLAAVLWLSAPELSDYVTIRMSHSGLQEGSFFRRIPSAILGYVWGGDSVVFAGVSHWGAVPRWAWLGLALGLVVSAREKPYWLAWALIGSLPLLSFHSAAEPQRLIIAWPAFCLIAGAGFDRFCEAGGRAATLLLVLLLACGLISEVWAFQRSQNGPGAQALLPSQQAIDGARRLRQLGTVEAYTDLDSESGAALRFVLADGGVAVAKGGTPVALLPWEYARGLERQGQIVPLSREPGPAPLLLYLPQPRMAARLARIDAQLHALWPRLPRYALRERRRLLLLELQDPAQAGMDPWLRSVLFEQALGQSMMLGEFPRELVESMKDKELQSVSALLWSVNRIGGSDPRAAQALKERAFALDPRRRQP